MKTKYRVVRDIYLGYEVQVRFWWLPFFWFQCFNNSFVNTFSTLEEAKEFAKNKANNNYSHAKDKQIIVAEYTSE